MSAAKRRRLDLETNSGGSTTGPAARSMGSRQRAAAASKAANAAQSAAAAAAVAASGNGRYGNENGAHVPILSLATLPVAALSRYALHYGLIPPEPLTPAQATHPTPALPLKLKLADSPIVSNKRRASLVPERPHKSTQEEDGNERGSRQEAEQSRHTLGVPDGDSGQINKASEEGHSLLRSSDDQTREGQWPHMVATSVRPDLESQYPEANQQEWMDPGEPDAEELRGMSAFDGGTEQFRERLGRLATVHWDRSMTVKEGETIINFAYAVRMRSKVLKSVPAS